MTFETFETSDNEYFLCRKADLATASSELSQASNVGCSNILMQHRGLLVVTITCFNLNVQKIERKGSRNYLVVSLPGNSGAGCFGNPGQLAEAGIGRVW